MRSSFPPLSCLLAFEAAARRASFSAAAIELHLTPSAVSHQIAKLEELLGVRLFERSARSIALTEAGREYMSRVSGALDAISSATDNARKGVRNALYVHAAPSFASLWLMPRLANFAQAHPGIALSLSSSDTACRTGRISMCNPCSRNGFNRWRARRSSKGIASRTLQTC
jgi:DNA-binding transcriptional LysR family regulator